MLKRLALAAGAALAAGLIAAGLAVPVLARMVWS
jgi:hypothetical protein